MDWYGVLKVLVVSWEADDEICIHLIKMYSLCDPKPCEWRSLTLSENIRVVFWLSERTSFPRLDQLQRELMQAYSDEFRGIIFVQQRITTHVLGAVLIQL